MATERPKKREKLQKKEDSRRSPKAPVERRRQAANKVTDSYQSRDDEGRPYYA